MSSEKLNVTGRYEERVKQHRQTQVEQMTAGQVRQADDPTKREEKTRASIPRDGMTNRTKVGKQTKGGCRR